MALGEKHTLKRSGLWTICLFVLAAGCTQGHCRRRSDLAPETKEVIKEIQGALPKSERRVRVFKYDGSLQCNKGRKIPLTEMAEELSGIRIFSSDNQQDDKMRIQMCGAITGRANVYEILSEDLPKAESKGFKVWQVEGAIR